MPQVRADSVNLYYETVGEGEPLVLVHGSWNDRKSWQAAIEADMRASFTVISYDRRGHGQSAEGRRARAPAGRTRTTLRR